MSQSLLGNERETLLARLQALARRDGHGLTGEWRELNALTSELSDLFHQIDEAETVLRRQNDQLRAARLAMEAERHQYFELFELAPDGYVVTAPEGGIRALNRAAAAMLNVPVSHAVGKPFQVFVARGDRAAFRHRLEAARRITGSEACEVRLEARGAGPIIHVEVRINAVFGNQGKVSALRLILRDVTDRVRAEQQVRALNADLEARVAERTTQLEQALEVNVVLLQRTEALRAEADSHRRRLLAVLSQIPEGVAIFDAPDGRLALCNAAGRHLWNLPEGGDYARDWMTGARLLEPLAPPDADDHAPFVRALNGEMVLSVEVEINHRDDRRLVLLVNAAPVVADTGEIVAAVAVWHDITQRKTMEEQKDNFLALAAHELKTPLTTIKGSVQVLQRFNKLGRLTLEQQDAMLLQHTGEAADTAIALITKLLDLTRIEIGRLDLEPERVDLAPILARLVMYQRNLRQSVSIVLEGADRPAEVIGDPTRLGQVFTNLLENAVKYSPEGGTVTMCLHTDDREIHLAVVDEGIGIPEADIPHVFERHYRASNVGRGQSGLGLGLYLCREIIERHGGRIWVESVERAGSTFHVALPVPPPHDDRGALDAQP